MGKFTHTTIEGKYPALEEFWLLYGKPMVVEGAYVGSWVS